MSAAQFTAAASQLIAESGVTVRRYRRSNSGVAYTKSDDWGIEAPEPRGPVSFATFAHEVGHQMLHRAGRSRKTRWLVELEAWSYALEQFARFDLPGFDKAAADALKAMRHAAEKSRRRGGSPASDELLAAWLMGVAP